MYRFLYILVPIFTFASVFSQNREKVAELYFEGNEYIMSEEYIEALPIFLELLEMWQTENFYYKVGECYLHLLNQKDKAIPYLEKAVENVKSDYNPADPTEAHAPLKAMLYLGRAYRINNEIDKAVQIFNTLIDSVAGREQSTIDAIAREIEISENARLFLESPVSFDSTNLGININDHFSNYGAVLTDDSGKIYFMNALKFYDAVMESTKKDGRWLKADNITMKLKSDGDFYVTDVSKDGTKLLFYFYNILTMGDIYESNFIDGEWSPIAKLKGTINTDYNETHATISADGKTMYFTSNRPGGKGGADIYLCTLNDSNEWTNPVNLGSAINTSKNEETPFITKNGKTLYFASEGHFNMGEFDVFKAQRLSDGTWGKPKNLGYPVNNTDINLFYYPHNDGNSLFLSKYVPHGEGQKDILKYWNISEPMLRKFKINTQITTLDSTGDKIPGIMLTIFESNRIHDTVKLYKGAWKERFRAGEYTLIATAAGFKPDTVTFTLDNNQEELDIPVELSLVPENREQKKHSAQVITVKNLIFGFDSYALSAEHKAFLNRLYQEIEGITFQLEITGHSDSKGPASYNLLLSYKRAEAVYDYLESIGIPEEKMNTKGMGEKIIVAKETDSDGNDIPEGRKYNRRVEIHFKELPEGIEINKELQIPSELLIEK